MLKDDRTIKRYSESFKLKVLSELADGKYTKNEIRRVYGISLGGLDNWIKKYHRFDLLNQCLKIETPKIKIKTVQFGFKYSNEDFDRLKKHFRKLFFKIGEIDAKVIQIPRLEHSPLKNIYR